MDVQLWRGLCDSLPPPLVLSIVLLLTGCDAEWRVRAECSTRNQCSVSGEISGRIHRKSSGVIVPSIDVSSTVISIEGSTVSLPFEGIVTLKAMNSATGATIGVSTQSWSRVGTQIRFSSPLAVNAWANSQQGADSLAFELDPVSVVASQGSNELSVVLVHDGQARAAQSTFWTSNCSALQYDACIE